MIFIIWVANDFSIKMNSKGQSNDSLCITDGVQTPLSYSGQKQNSVEDRMRLRPSILLHALI